jgi:hypothetical protein
MNSEFHGQSLGSNYPYDGLKSEQGWIKIKNANEPYLGGGVIEAYKSLL